jgi:hypothetical protein
VPDDRAREDVPTERRATRPAMSDRRSADIPLAIDRVDCTRTSADGVELRLTGRWTNGGNVTGTEPLLVVQVQGRRHRFTPDRDGYTPPPGSWAATFQLPSWAQPRQGGQAALWVGTAVVPIPLPGAASDGLHHLPSPPAPAPGSPGSDGVHRPPPPPALGEARAWPADVAPPPADGDLRGQLQELTSAVATQRDDFEGRLSEAEERAGEAEAALARGRADLETERASAAARLADVGAARDAAVQEAVELRHRLAAAASGRQHHAAELSALRDQLGAAQVSREAAASEVAGLRVELERLGSELAVTREHQAAQGADLGEAERLLAEARSLSEQLRSQSSQ